MKGLDNGTSENDVTYSSPDFSGQGKALDLNRKLSQYVRLPRSLNISMNTSFTVSVWIFSTRYNRATILSDCHTLNSVCIELFIYNFTIYARTYTWNNVNFGYLIVYEAWEVNYQSCWIYLVFTFDSQQKILSIYFNRDRMINRYFSPKRLAMATTNESVTSYIGLNFVLTNRTPFDGLIDQLSILYYVKNASEILDEATLLCYYYNFESDEIDYDIVQNNTWTHFSISYSNDGQLTFYLNGQLKHRTNIDTRFSLLLYNSRLAITIGGRYFDDMTPIKPRNYRSRKCFADNSQFNFTQIYGEIDDLKIFARALTDSEFIDLANTKKKLS